MTNRLLDSLTSGITRRRRMFFWTSIQTGLGIGLFLTGPSLSAQLPVGRDPQAILLLGQSLSALTGGRGIGVTGVQDATLTAQATTTEGSDVETGIAVLKARGYAQSNILLNLSGGQRQEVRNDFIGSWHGAQGPHHDTPIHNAWTAASWFSPALVIQAAYLRSDLALTYAGSEMHNGTPVQHVQISDRKSTRLNSSH